MLKEFKKLKGKQVKIVYQENPSKEPFISEGKLIDATQSFVTVRGKDGLVHFIAMDKVVRLSERFPERERETDY